jgi:hypothetical protein
MASRRGLETGTFLHGIESSTTNTLHQRVGSISNVHVGAGFEKAALQFFEGRGVKLTRNFPLEIGIVTKKKHTFDLGSDHPKMIIECKSHKWTEGDKVPSAKMATWNEAMFYFHLAPRNFKKIFFTLHHIRRTTGESLVSYYKRTYFHLIPEEVEFLEFDEHSGDIIRE